MGPPVPSPESIVAGVAAGFAAVGVLLAVIWPFVGTFIRYWANYTPKRIILGDESRGEGGSLEFDVTDDSQRSQGYWSLFRRVKRVEGLGGLWKGAGVFGFFVLFTGILYSLLIAGVLLISLGSTTFPKTGFYIIIPVVTLLSYLILIPFRVIVSRALATSKKLWVRQPMKAYKALLNPIERKNPLKLCLLPGVTFGIILGEVVQSIIGVARAANLMRPNSRLSIVGLVLSALINTIMALAFIPFQVAVTRLALQERNSPAPVPIGEGDAPATEPQVPQLPTFQQTEGAELSGAEEDVINIRTGQEPYKGLFDALKTIKREEGCATLWRGWLGIALIFFLSEMPYRFIQMPPKGPASPIGKFF